MKRFALFLLCLLLLLSASACGSRAAAPTVPQAEAPEELLPSSPPTPSPTPELDYSACLAELVNFCVANMYTRYYDNAEVTRFDLNSDGVPDWLVYKQAEDPRGAWLMLDGSVPAESPAILYDISAAGGIQIYYSETLGSAVVYKYYGTSGYSVGYYLAFDREPGRCLAYSSSVWEHDDVFSLEWQIDGENCGEEEWNAYVDSLALVEPGEPEPASNWKNMSLDLPADALGGLAGRLAELPIVYEQYSGDIDGDGVDDHFFVLSTGAYGVNDLGERYYMSGDTLSEYDSYAVGAWGDCDLLLLSNAGSPTAGVVEDYDTCISSFREAAFSGGRELSGIEADGDYKLCLYKDLVSRTDGGWLAYAELMKPVTVSDEALRAGLGDGYDVSYENGYQRIYDEDGWHIYHRSSDSESWTVSAMSDVVLNEAADTGIVFIPDAATYEDYMNETMFGIAREVTSLPELFETSLEGFTYSNIDVIVTVSGGEISNILFPYSP